MVCLRFLVLSVKIRISRIQKQTCLRFCQGGVSSAASKIGDKRRKPALRKLSFHQFFGNLPFFRTRLRSPRRDFPRSAPFLSECRAAQGAHSPRTALPDVFPFPAAGGSGKIPVRKSACRFPEALLSKWLSGQNTHSPRTTAAGRSPVPGSCCRNPGAFCFGTGPAAGSEAVSGLTGGYSTGSGHALLRRMNSTTSFSPSANFEKSSL